MFEDLVERLERAVHALHNGGSDYGELEAAKAALRASLSQGEPANWTANCCQCGRIVDTREKAEGGDPFGCQLDDKRWTCSPQCWERVVDPASPQPLQGAVPDGWRSMDSAPKDGTALLGICMDAQYPKACVTWWSDGWILYSRLEPFSAAGERRWWPTHWMSRDACLPKTDAQKLAALDDWMVEQILGASDEEILAEAGPGDAEAGRASFERATATVAAATYPLPRTIPVTLTPDGRWLHRPDELPAPPPPSLDARTVEACDLLEAIERNRWAVEPQVGGGWVITGGDDEQEEELHRSRLGLRMAVQAALRALKEGA